ncbi:MAG: bacteriohemerythrin [Negativicutes bacterium]|nr:bacteriohemerythrin [Negativicutes bacterium]
MVLEWKKNYSVGVAKLDEEHQRLFELLADIYTAAWENRAGMEEQLFRLIDRMQAHFISEEGYMRRYGYPQPQLVSHIAEHERLIATLLQWHEQAASRRSPGVYRVVKFIGEWYLSHITGCDRQFGRFLAEKIDSAIDAVDCKYC